MKKFKLKKKNIFLIGVLAIAALFGVSSAVINKQINEEPVVEKADAAEWSNMTIYISVYSGFFSSGAQLRIIFEGPSSNWNQYTIATSETSNSRIATANNTEYLYKYSFPSNVWRFMFQRTDSSGNQWGYTSNYECGDDYKNLYRITGYGSGEYLNSSADGVKICHYNFASPTNGSVTVALTDSGGASMGDATLGGAGNYIYSDWKVTLTATPDSGCVFSHWTESTNGGSSYVAWSGSDFRDNPKSNMTSLSGNVYHGAHFQQYKTIYYISGEDYTTTNKIYAWTSYLDGNGETKTIEEFGAYASCSNITAVGSEIFSNGVVHFNGSQNKIYKISLFSDHFKLKSSDGTFYTGDFDVADGSGYYWAEANADAGTAIALIEDEETARNAVSESGSIKQYSICGIPKSTINSLVSRYNGLSSGAKTLVDDSTAYTYAGAGTSTETDVSFAAIFNQLKKMSDSKGLSAINVFSSLFGGSEDGLSTTIIIVSSSIALLSVTALSILVIRKRKQKDE